MIRGGGGIAELSVRGFSGKFLVLNYSLHNIDWRDKMRWESHTHSLDKFWSSD